MLALKRMALLSRAESSASGSPTSPRAGETLTFFYRRLIQTFLFAVAVTGFSPLYPLHPCPRLPPQPGGKACPAVSGAQDARPTPLHPEPGGPDGGPRLQGPSLLSPHRYTRLQFVLFCVSFCCRAVTGEKNIKPRG